MKSEIKIHKWYREIKSDEKSFSFGVMNKTGHVMRKITRTPLWATKSYEIWLLLQNILFLTKPKRILEYGSGRSTSYLSEYAFKNNAILISIEHNFYYYLKVKIGLNLSFLYPDYLKYVPLQDGWYNIKKLDNYLSDFEDIDFFYLDGPSNIYFEERDPEIFYKYMIPKLNNIKVVLIDDTHIENCNILTQKITSKLNLIRYDADYMAGITKNKLSILLDKNSDKLLAESMPDYLKELLIKN